MPYTCTLKLDEPKDFFFVLFAFFAVKLFYSTFNTM
jgi:hypothetical protein